MDIARQLQEAGSDLNAALAPLAEITGVADVHGVSGVPDGEESQERKRAKIERVPSIVRRILSPIWSEALASGQKFSEVQRYSGYRLNQMRWGEEGAFMVFGAAGERTVAGIAVAQGPCQEATPTTVLDCVGTLSETLIPELGKYVSKGVSFDIVHFSRVSDLRALGLTWAELGEVIGARVPDCSSGFPRFQRTVAVRDALLKLSSREGVITRFAR